MIYIEPTAKGIELIYPNGEKRCIKFESKEKFISEVNGLLKGTTINGNSYQLDITINITGIGLGYAELLADEGFTFKTIHTMRMPEFINLKSLLEK